jgi:hypothetical protein
MLHRRPGIAWKYIAQIEESCRGKAPNLGHLAIQVFFFFSNNAYVEIEESCRGIFFFVVPRQGPECLVSAVVCVSSVVRWHTGACFKLFGLSSLFCFDTPVTCFISLVYLVLSHPLVQWCVDILALVSTGLILALCVCVCVRARASVFC